MFFLVIYGENSNLQNLSSFPYLAIYSELSSTMYASFGGGGSHLSSNNDNVNL